MYLAQHIASYFRRVFDFSLYRKSYFFFFDFWAPCAFLRKWDSKINLEWKSALEFKIWRSLFKWSGRKETGTINYDSDFQYCLLLSPISLETRSNLPFKSSSFLISLKIAFFWSICWLSTNLNNLIPQKLYIFIFWTEPTHIIVTP